MFFYYYYLLTYPFIIRIFLQGLAIGSQILKSPINKHDQLKTNIDIHMHIIRMQILSEVVATHEANLDMPFCQLKRKIKKIKNSPNLICDIELSCLLNNLDTEKCLKIITNI